MTSRAPAHPIGVRTAIKRTVRRVLEDMHVSHDCVAAAADVSRQRVERQLDGANDAQPPLYWLAVLPDDVADRIVEELRSLRRPTPTVTPEASSMRVLGDLGTAVHAVASAVSDGSITPLEATDVRRKLAALRAELDTACRVLGERERRVVQ